jgi:NTE family protein
VLDALIRRGRNGGVDSQKVGLGSIRRPIIGLALGGGSARGFAHIGIIRTLLAHGIIPDVVVGTSIGAVVGGAYVSGHLDTLEEWARSLQPRNILSYLDIRLDGSGLIGGDKLAAQLEASVGQTVIEDLPQKFASVATEVRTGHEIWLTHGRMVEAMRASYALPGIFSPVRSIRFQYRRRAPLAPRSSSPPISPATCSPTRPRSIRTASRWTSRRP